MPLARFKEQLRTVCDFSDDECALFVPFLKDVTLRKGEYFLQPGQSPDQIAFVLSGGLRMFYLSEEGKEINVHFFLDNDYATSYLDFLKTRPSRYAIQAIEDCVLLTFDAQALNMAYEHSKNWERFGRLVAESVYATASARFESFLFLSAKERYLAMLEEYPLFIKRIPLYHLASYIGIERESLSRIRSELTSEMRM